MKTRCPNCQTTFRVTPEQLKARAGKVRCGQCQTVFNALDSLLEEPIPASPSLSPAVAPNEDFPESSETLDIPPEPESVMLLSTTDQNIDILLEPLETTDTAEPVKPLSESQAQELGKATGLILPRETTEIPGYSKWTEGVMATAFSSPEIKSSRWPFILVAILLAAGLVGQMTFRFRSELAISAPFLRPLLESLSQAVGSEIPLPRHVELVSIEASDLQNDAAHGNLLVLNATLRNRAGYNQAYPSLELSLTDTQDAAIARKVFAPAEYLSSKLPADPPFAANTDTAIRLWIEAKDISAAGYRLYVFYP